MLTRHIHQVLRLEQKFFPHPQPSGENPRISHSAHQPFQVPPEEGKGSPVQSIQTPPLPNQIKETLTSETFLSSAQHTKELNSVTLFTNRSTSEPFPPQYNSCLPRTASQLCLKDAKITIYSKRKQTKPHGWKSECNYYSKGPR